MRRRRYIEVAFGNNDAARLLLSKEKGVLFEGNKAYLLQLIDKKNISSCQQNQRINAIKFYYEKVLGNECHCYKVNRAKREKTPDDINISRSLIHVGQGKGKKDRYTLLSKPFINKLEEYRIAYQPEKWLFEREAGVQFSESISPLVPPFVRYTFDRTRNGLENHKRTVGAWKY